MRLDQLNQEVIQQELQDELFDNVLDRHFESYLYEGGVGSGRKPSKRKVGRPSNADRKRYQYNMKRRKNPLV